MSAPEPTVPEEDLQAYVDGQLSNARFLAVTRYLDTHPSEAARVARYSQQREALRRAFKISEADPLPPRLDRGRLLEAQMRRRLRRYVAAAAALAFIVGSTGGWVLHSSLGSSRAAHAMSVLQEEALTAHAVYTGDRRHPGEIATGGNDIWIVSQRVV